VCLGTNEDVGQAVPDAIANPDPEVFHEVIAAGVVGATGDVTGGEQGEAVAGDADTGHDVEAKLLSELRLEERVDVGEYGAVVFIAEVACLVIPPRSFKVQAEAALPEADEVTADADISAVRLRRWMEVHRIANPGKRLEGGAANEDIYLLLGRGEAGKQKNRTRGREQREFSQYKSPCQDLWNASARLVAPRPGSSNGPQQPGYWNWLSRIPKSTATGALNP
jgi:hypothetical protein